SVPEGDYAVSSPRKTARASAHRSAVLHRMNQGQVLPDLIHASSSLPARGRCCAAWCAAFSAETLPWCGLVLELEQTLRGHRYFLSRAPAVSRNIDWSCGFYIGLQLGCRTRRATLRE